MSENLPPRADEARHLEEQARRLLARDYLYENPESYRAGVMEALRAVAREGRRPHLRVRA